jgi:hypothetical protein
VAGSLVGTGFIPPKASYADAELALRADLVRGLIARVELLCDDIADEEEEAGGEAGGSASSVADPMWSAGLKPTTLPLRAEIGMPGASPITFSDYAFPDDEAINEEGEGGDSASRMNELLG